MQRPRPNIDDQGSRGGSSAHHAASSRSTSGWRPPPGHLCNRDVPVPECSLTGHARRSRFAEFLRVKSTSTRSLRHIPNATYAIPRRIDRHDWAHEGRRSITRSASSLSANGRARHGARPRLREDHRDAKYGESSRPHHWCPRDELIHELAVARENGSPSKSRPGDHAHHPLRSCSPGHSRLARQVLEA